MTIQERAHRHRRRRVLAAAALIAGSTAPVPSQPLAASTPPEPHGEGVTTTLEAPVLASGAVVLSRPARRAASHQQQAASQRPAVPVFRPGDPTPAQWLRLRLCESSNNYRSDAPPHYGAYQFNIQTWLSVGGHGNPARATRAEQDRRALILWRDRGWQPWPTCGRRAA